MKMYRRNNSNRIFAFACGLLAFLMLSTISTTSDARQLWQSREQFVALERQDSSQNGNTILNDHPIEISTDRLTAMLASIELLAPDINKPEQLITKQSLEVLVPQLVQAFRKATSGEDVTFAIIGLHSSLFGFAKSPKVTTGRAYYQGGRLNFIFGLAQKDVNEREDRRLYPFTPGSRQKSMAGEWKLVPQSGQNGFALVRSDWVAFNDDWRSTVVQTRSVEPNVSTAPATIAHPIQQQQAPSPFAEQTAVPAAPATVQQIVDPRKPAERLTTLNELKEKGLITEQEYRSKRMEILNGL